MAGVTIGKVTAIDLDRDSFTGTAWIQLHLNPWIADGSIHAVTMKFFSRADWASRA
ncbi:hypothetical protein SSTU70S_01140 [Stutzerimonas stutzeri]